MSIFEQKYEENLKAGDKLLQDGLYNACIHCYYYACYQLLLHIIDTTKIAKPTLSHVQTIKNIVGACNAAIRTQVLVDLGGLKEIRQKADYKKIQILKGDAIAAKKSAEYVIQLLQIEFNV